MRLTYRVIFVETYYNEDGKQLGRVRCVSWVIFQLFFFFTFQEKTENQMFVSSFSLPGCVCPCTLRSALLRSQYQRLNTALHVSHRIDALIDVLR